MGAPSSLSYGVPVWKARCIRQRACARVALFGEPLIESPRWAPRLDALVVPNSLEVKQIGGGADHAVTGSRPHLDPAFIAHRVCTNQYMQHAEPAPFIAFRPSSNLYLYSWLKFLGINEAVDMFNRCRNCGNCTGWHR